MEKEKALLNEQEGLDAIMEILEGVQIKTGAPLVSIQNTDKSKSQVNKPSAAPSEDKKAGPTVTYEHGKKIAVDGKKTTTGPKKRTGGKGGAAKEDAGKDALKEVYMKAVAALAKHYFIHSTEGVVVRQEEADYTIKVSKAKEFKYDITDEDFEVEKDFTTRGKAKNSAPALAKAILVALEKSEHTFDLISAKASGIILQMMGGEYTIKISKKRDRVGFEAEKAAAYDK